jgi:hypothetical protein
LCLVHEKSAGIVLVDAAQRKQASGVNQSETPNSKSRNLSSLLVPTLRRGNELSNR